MLPVLTTFFIISLSGALSPGPLTTVAIVEGSRRGKWSGVKLALGHGLVEAPYMAAIALLMWFGRDSILRQPLIAGLVALIGGAFLVWMGWSMASGSWRGRLNLDDQGSQEARFNLVTTGSLVTLSNPYWWVWWALITPLYIADAFIWGALGVIILFLFHWSTDLGWLTGISWVSGSGRGIISPRIYRWVLIACGGFLIFFGISFIIAGIRFITTGNVEIG